MVFVQLLCNHADERGIRDHADLYGVGRDVGKDGIELRREECGRDGEDVGNARSVLRGQCGDGSHAVNAVRGHGLEIRLNARATARIAARNGECCVHFHRVPSLELRDSAVCREFFVRHAVNAVYDPCAVRGIAVALPHLRTCDLPRNAHQGNSLGNGREKSQRLNSESCRKEG